MTRFHPTHGTRVTSGFRTKTRPTHDGTDYAAAIGTPVHATLAGTVTLVGHGHVTAGNYVQIQHSTNPKLITVYLHLSETKVTKGQRVTGDQVIGLSGDTGNATGPCVHFGVKAGSDYVDPVTWLKSEPKASSTTTAPKASTKAPKASVILREYGDNDPAKVKKLQRVLNAWYPFLTPLKEDGIYGQRTGDRVQYAQQRLHIADDRVAGPITLGELHITF